MTTAMHKGERWTLKALDLRWQELELDIEKHQHIASAMAQATNTVIEQGFKADWSAHSIVLNKIAEMCAEQAEVEIILVENEAPGWTST